MLTPQESTQTKQEQLHTPQLGPKELMRQRMLASKHRRQGVAALQSGVLRGVADVVAHRDSVDPAHTTAIFLLAFFVSGLGNAMWLRRLETMYGTGTEPATLARKTATDYSVWAPFANSAYLLGVPLLTGHDVAAALSTLQSGFLSVMLMELCIFAPYNLFAFRSISLNLRPAVSAVLAFAFTIGLSSQC